MSTGTGEFPPVQFTYENSSCNKPMSYFVPRFTVLRIVDNVGIFSEKNKNEKEFLTVSPNKSELYDYPKNLQ